MLYDNFCITKDYNVYKKQSRINGLFYMTRGTGQLQKIYRTDWQLLRFGFGGEFYKYHGHINSLINVL